MDSMSRLISSVLVTRGFIIMLFFLLGYKFVCLQSGEAFFFEEFSVEDSYLVSVVFFEGGDLPLVQVDEELDGSGLVSSEQSVKDTPPDVLVARVSDYDFDQVFAGHPAFIIVVRLPCRHFSDILRERF